MSCLFTARDLREGRVPDRAVTVRRWISARQSQLADLAAAHLQRPTLFLHPVDHLLPLVLPFLPDFKGVPDKICRASLLLLPEFNRRSDSADRAQITKLNLDDGMHLNRKIFDAHASAAFHHIVDKRDFIHDERAVRSALFAR